MRVVYMNLYPTLLSDGKEIPLTQIIGFDPVLSWAELGYLLDLQDFAGSLQLMFWFGTKLERAIPKYR